MRWVLLCVAALALIASACDRGPAFEQDAENPDRIIIRRDEGIDEAQRLISEIAGYSFQIPELPNCRVSGLRAEPLPGGTTRVVIEYAGTVAVVDIGPATEIHFYPERLEAPDRHRLARTDDVERLPLSRHPDGWQIVYTGESINFPEWRFISYFLVGLDESLEFVRWDPAPERGHRTRGCNLQRHEIVELLRELAGY